MNKQMEDYIGRAMDEMYPSVYDDNRDFYQTWKLAMLSSICNPEKNQNSKVAVILKALELAVIDVG